MSILYGVREMAREAAESLYSDRCSIWTYETAIDEKTGLEAVNPILVYENLFCRISYKTIAAVNQTEAGGALEQTVTLFLSPDIVIKPGSMIQIIKNGETTEYECSGKPACYMTHQEVLLKLKVRWA